jgi:hypothetical protein
MKGGGQPATATTDDHRDPGARAPERMAGRRQEPPPVADPDPEPLASEPEVVEPETLEKHDTAPEPATPEPVSLASVDLLEPEPEPELPAATEPVRRSVPAGQLRRGDRTRATERVRARRRDHRRLGREDEAEVLLVAPAEVPQPQAARTRPTSRLRSALILVAIVIVVGASAAILLGVTAMVISDFLENAVK